MPDGMARKFNYYRIDFCIKYNYSHTNEPQSSASRTESTLLCGAKCHVCCTKEIYDCRWLRRLALKTTRDYPAVRLPSSDDYVFLIRLSAICLYTVVTGLVLFDAYKPPPRLSTRVQDERSKSHRDRNSPKLDFRSLLASHRPGEVSKITLLSGCHPTVSERNESRRSLLWRPRCNGEISRHGNWQMHHVRRNTSPEASYSSPK